MFFIKNLSLISLLFTFKWVQGTVEFCSPGSSSVVYRITNKNCPYGVLFKNPIDAACFESNDADIDNFLSDICPATFFESDTNTNNENAPKIHLITKIDDLTLEETCIGETQGQCNATEDQIIEITSENLTPPITEADVSEIAAHTESQETEDDHHSLHNDTKVVEQTRRLFKFLIGIKGQDIEVSPPGLRKRRSLNGVDGEIDDDDDDDARDGHTKMEKARLRITKILRKTFKILTSHCDHRYVPRAFLKDVERGFLFLAGESEVSQVEDVTQEDYEIINSNLNECLAFRKFFQLNGTKCRTYSTVESIEKGNKSFIYKPNEFSFKWGKYDFPVDAAWGAIDFVHGLCYGTYAKNVNHHHLYQRAMERFFTSEIIYRWKRPPELYNEEIWDNFFSAPVSSAMKNLDVCIYAAYTDTPFRHRLERPLIHFVPEKDTSGKRRKKRSVLTLDEMGLANSGWCIQTEEQLKQTVLQYIGVNCFKYPIISKYKDLLPNIFS